MIEIHDLKQDEDIWDDICVDVQEHEDFKKFLKLVDQEQKSEASFLIEDILDEVWYKEYNRREQLGLLNTGEDYD